MKKNKILLLFTLGLFSVSTSAQVDEQTKFQMFCSALNNFSTAPNILVVTVKNKNTGETKEICTEAPFLKQSVNRDNGIKINPSDCEKYKDRYFEFSMDSALWNIGYNLYTIAELDSFAKTINLERIIRKVKKGKLTSKTFMGPRKEQRMFAHLMFNNGVMMTRGCMGGNQCSL